MPHQYIILIILIIILLGVRLKSNTRKTTEGMTTSTGTTDLEAIKSMATIMKSGNSSLTNLNVTNNFVADKGATFKDNITVDKGATFKDNITVDKEATFNTNVNVKKKIVVNAEEESQIKGNLNIDAKKYMINGIDIRDFMIGAIFYDTDTSDDNKINQSNNQWYALPFVFPVGNYELRAQHSSLDRAKQKSRSDSFTMLQLNPGFSVFVSVLSYGNTSVDHKEFENKTDKAIFYKLNNVDGKNLSNRIQSIVVKKL